MEECLFIPLLMTEFTRENIYKWRDVLADNLLPMPSETYLQPFNLIRGGRQHPLLKGVRRHRADQDKLRERRFSRGCLRRRGDELHHRRDIHVHTICPGRNRNTTGSSPGRLRRNRTGHGRAR